MRLDANAGICEIPGEHVRSERGKVIVVGAGGAGLAGLHAMRQAGFDAVAFDQHGEIGGVWAKTLTPALTIHSRSFNYRFHDYPPVRSAGPSATREEIRAYFDEFTRAKGLVESITLHRRVERIAYRPWRESGRCLVHAVDVRGGTRSEHACDVVVCASGFANAGRPHVPALEGRATSNVRVLHSSELSSTIHEDILAHRRKVVVLGAGKSAQEVLSLYRNTPTAPDLTWVYVKSLWSLSYEKLYARSALPLNVLLYVYYVKLAALRRRAGFGPWMKALQGPLRWSGLLVNPLEPRSDVCQNRTAIMKEDQLAFLRTVRSIKGSVTGVGDRRVVLADGRTLEADVLICATGYDRAGDLPVIMIESPDGSSRAHDLTEQHGFYQQMIDVAVPEISVLAASVLYPQQLLGYSLGAQWLARFHTRRLRSQPTEAEMARSLRADAASFEPWRNGAYLSGGQPYAHQRNEDVLPRLFAQMGLEPALARSLVRRGANERAFGALCDEIARRLAYPQPAPGGGGRNPLATNRST